MPLIDEAVDEKLECPLRPMAGKIIVRASKPKTKMGRIWIPDNAQRTPTIGEVVRIADGVTKIKVGDRVIYTQFTGTLISLKRHPWYICMGEDEVFAIVEVPDVEQELQEGQAQ